MQRVVEVCEQLALAAQACLVFRRDDAGFDGHHFERDLLLGHQVPRAVDNAGAAAADLAFDYEAAAHAASLAGGGGHVTRD